MARMIRRLAAVGMAALGIAAWSAVPAQAAAAPVAGSTVAIQVEHEPWYVTADPDATYYGHTYTRPASPGHVGQRWEITAHPSGTGSQIRSVDYDECLTEVIASVASFVTTEPCSTHGQAWQIATTGSAVQLMSTRLGEACATGYPEGETFMWMLRCGYQDFEYLQRFTLVTL